MNYLKETWQTQHLRIIIALTLCTLAYFGLVDAAAAGSVFLVGDTGPTTVKELHDAMTKAFEKLQDGIKRNQDEMSNVIEQVKRGDEVHAKSADKLKELGEANAAAQKKFTDSLNEFAARMKEVEQKVDKRPGPTPQQIKTWGEAFIESESYKSLMKVTNNGNSRTGWNSDGVACKAAMLHKAAVLNVYPLTNDQPLVQAFRVPGIIGPGLRRFTIRDLLPSVPTTSNLIEYASELVYTSGAAPQYDGSSPAPAVEGVAKGEASLTFQLANSPVITLAHFIPASRQILSDAPSLAGYINTRLIYGLKLEEEDELLNADGTAGKLNGLRNQATTFAGGATNQNSIDTLLKAFTQVSLSFFESTGVVLHPSDWMRILLLKDTQGRYLYADPHNANEPRIWGKPVVPTVAMTEGQFLTGAFDLAASIFDREDVNIRVAEQHSDWFTKNLVAILCEERLALVVFRTAAMVKGPMSHAG